MISSLFGKTKPINFIIVLTLLCVLFVVVRIFNININIEPSHILFVILTAIILIMSIFAINFIIIRNKLTETNTFAILFFSLLVFAFSRVLLDNNAIICNFFVLLALRRLISIKSLKSVKFKIFDAVLWILVASLFYKWALLYLLLVVVAIYFYDPRNIKNWMVIPIASTTFFLIAYAILILIDKQDFLETHYLAAFNFNMEFYLDWSNSSKLLVLFIITSFTGIWAFLKIGKSGVGRIITMRLIAISFFIALVVVFLETSETVFPVLLTFFPAIIFVTNYLEALKKPRIREAILVIAILGTVSILISDLLLS